MRLTEVAKTQNETPDDNLSEPCYTRLSCIFSELHSQNSLELKFLMRQWVRQGDIAPMATTSQLNEKIQELIRLFTLTKKTLPILSYKNLNDESIKPVLNTFAGWEPNNESPLLSISAAKYITANLINISTAV